VSEGIAFGNAIPPLGGGIRSSDVTFVCVLNWDNPSGTVFEVGGGTNGIQARFSSTTNLKIATGNSTSTAEANITVPAVSGRPLEIVVAVDVSARTLKVWVDGTLAATETDEEGNWTTWAGVDDGGYGKVGDHDGGNPAAILTLSSADNLTGIKYASQLSIYYGQLPENF
jgi:hypothetical protein